MPYQVHRIGTATAAQSNGRRAVERRVQADESAPVEGRCAVTGLGRSHAIRKRGVQMPRVGRGPLERGTGPETSTHGNSQRRTGGEGSSRKQNHPSPLCMRWVDAGSGRRGRGGTPTSG